MDYQENGAGLLVPESAIGKGLYTGTIIRGGYFDDDGVWHRGKNVIDHFEFDNLVVDQGLTDMLGVHLHGDAQKASWYVGVYSNNYTPTNALTALTVASTAGENTAYTGTTRVAYTPAAAANKAITNAASRADFVFTADATIYGAFLISDGTKSGTGGVLFSAARFGAAKTVATSDELLLTYAFSLSSS